LDESIIVITVPESEVSAAAEKNTSRALYWARKSEYEKNESPSNKTTAL
jgi:hypothetical protein